MSTSVNHYISRRYEPQEHEHQGFTRVPAPFMRIGVERHHHQEPHRQHSDSSCRQAEPQPHEEEQYSCGNKTPDRTFVLPLSQARKEHSIPP